MKAKRTNSKMGLEVKPKQVMADNRFILEPIQTVEGEVRLKKYIKLKVVGQGSYSKCFLVKNTESDSTYVVKIIPKRKLEVLEKEKLIYEIKIHKSLSNPHIVHLDHWFQDEDYQYIFLQHCSNGNLENRLNDSFLPEKSIQVYGVQIIKAIAYCHSQKILHRDLKLSNFYFDSNDHLKLGDFGFACQLANEYDKKRETCGTPNYIAPEAVSGFGYSFSSDVWAVGVILYRMKYGCCPFEGQTVRKTLQNVKTCHYSFPKSPKISSELKDLITKIFNINYDDRVTLEQILDHPFFNENSSLVKKQKSNKGFSLLKFFQGGDKDQSPKFENKPRQGMINRDSRNPSTKLEEPKRHNSCETMKQMKQIFKSKSKPTLTTTQGKQMWGSSPYANLNLTMNTLSSGPNNSTQIYSANGSKSNRYNIVEYDFESSMISGLNENNTHHKSSARIGRLNEFIKTQVCNLQGKKSIAQKGKQVKTLLNQEPVLNIRGCKTGKEEKLKLPGKQKQEESSERGDMKKQRSDRKSDYQILTEIMQKNYLPMKIQQQKDVLIIHYSPILKQLIFMNDSFLIFRGIQSVYAMSGNKLAFQDLHEVVQHIVTKIEVQEKEDHENEDREEEAMELLKKLRYLPKTWLTVKEGIVLQYKPAGSIEFRIGKLTTQEGFYISMNSESKSSKQLSFMYRYVNKSLQRLEGVVVMRIYERWMKNLIK